MSEAITLALPDELAAKLRAIAQQSDQSVEELLVQALRALPDPVAQLPADEQAELRALRQLSDDSLWTLARDQLPQDVQARAHDLMTRNNRGALAPAERDELEQLVQRADRLMLRKAEAAAILRERGHNFRDAPPPGERQSNA